MAAAPAFRLDDVTPPDPRRVWGDLDGSVRNACYDNNAGVTDSAAQIAVRNAASADYRALHPASLDIPYAKGERNAFDLYPAADPAAPCLVFIHGGYWQRNARADFACFAGGLNAVGWSVAMPGYTLAPAVSLDGIVAEIGAALDWLGHHGAAHGIAGRLVLAGWSAGAQLAVLHLGHPAVAGVLAISGVYDLAPLRDTAFDDKLRLTDAEIETLSPLRRPVVDKPVTIAYGTRELPALVNDARNLHAWRSAAHAPGVLLPVPRADHFSILNGFLHADSVLVRAAQALLESVG